MNSGPEREKRLARSGLERIRLDRNFSGFSIPSCVRGSERKLENGVESIGLL